MVSLGRRLKGRRRVRWGYIFTHLPPYGVCCIHSTIVHSLLQLGSGNHSLLPPLRPQSGNSSALLVLGFSTTPCVSLHPAHTFVNSPLLNLPQIIQIRAHHLCSAGTLNDEGGTLAGKSRKIEICKDKGGFVTGFIF